MSDFAAQPAFTGMTPVSAAHPGVTVRLISPTLVSVLARKGAMPALTEKANSVFGLALADGPAHSSTASLSAIGLGPGRWMFVGAPPAGLEAAFAGLASLSDHSDGYAVFEIWGPDAHRALAKGVPLDLDLFSDKDAAVTSIAHIGAIVWKTGPERFAIAVFRSYAGSFWHWLHASAAEFGLVIEDMAPGENA